MISAGMKFRRSLLFVLLYIKPCQNLLIIVYLMSIPVVSFKLEKSFSHLAREVFFNPHVQYFHNLNPLLMKEESPRGFLSPVPGIRDYFKHFIHHISPLGQVPIFTRSHGL
jgi:hypothetical protein